MTRDKRKRAQMLAHCGEIHDDDGVDPREFFASGGRRHKQDHKARQLCRQVAETLGLVLAGEFDDEQLQSLHVVSVQPAPDASQLAVSVQCDIADVQAAQVHERLAAVAGRLRCVVAAAITRKRAPRLVFHVVAGIAVPESYAPETDLSGVDLEDSDSGEKAS